jgi:hypothetical protein
MNQILQMFYSKLTFFLEDLTGVIFNNLFIHSSIQESFLGNPNWNEGWLRKK